MLLGTLGASLLINILAGKGILRAGYGNKNNKNKFLMPPHPLANFEIQKYYQNEPRFIGVYSMDNLSVEIKDRAYITSLDEYSDIRTHWVVLYVKNNVKVM